jgi:hypothetical protein
MLPWSGETLNYVLFFGALVGYRDSPARDEGRSPLSVPHLELPGFVLMVKGTSSAGMMFQPNEFRIASYLIRGIAAGAVQPGSSFGPGPGRSIETGHTVSKTDTGQPLRDSAHRFRW